MVHATNQWHAFPLAPLLERVHPLQIRGFRGFTRVLVFVREYLVGIRVSYCVRCQCALLTPRLPSARDLPHLSAPGS